MSKKDEKEKVAPKELKRNPDQKDTPPAPKKEKKEKKEHVEEEQPKERLSATEESKNFGEITPAELAKSEQSKCPGNNSLKPDEETK